VLTLSLVRILHHSVHYVVRNLLYFHLVVPSFRWVLGGLGRGNRFIYCLFLRLGFKRTFISLLGLATLLSHQLKQKVFEFVSEEALLVLAVHHSDSTGCILQVDFRRLAWVQGRLLAIPPCCIRSFLVFEIPLLNDFLSCFAGELMHLPACSLSHWYPAHHLVPYIVVVWLNHGRPVSIIVKKLSSRAIEWT
jgi:hypothetical protein